MGKKEERAGLGEKMAGLNSDSFILGSCWRANQDVKEGLDISGVQERVGARVTSLRDFNIEMALKP